MIGRLRPEYYGWRITAALAFTETVSWGILYYAFSVFVVATRDDTGWSLAAINGAYSAALLASGACAPLVGRFIDRRGPRLIMTAGSVLGTLGVVLWSHAVSLPVYYAAWIMIGIAMSATLYDPAFATLTRWFDRSQARAILIVTIAGGFASTIFLPLAGVLGERLGWRDGVLWLALILGVATIPPHALILRNRPADLGLEVDGGVNPGPARHGSAVRHQGVSLQSALRMPAFWWMGGSFFLQSLATAGIVVSLIPYLTDRGDSPAVAATIAGFIGAVQVVARILTTAFQRHISVLAATAALFAVQALAVAILVQWEARAGVAIAVLLLGAGRGVITLMRPLLVAESFGRTHFGAISGATTTFIYLANAVAPIGAGILYGMSNDYEPVMWVLAVASILSAAAMVVAGRMRSGSAPPPAPGRKHGTPGNWCR